MSCISHFFPKMRGDDNKVFFLETLKGGTK